MRVNRFYSTFALFALLMAASACDIMGLGQDDEGLQATEAFRAELTVALEEYGELTEALSDNDMQRARSAAKDLEAALAGADPSSLNRKAADFWTRHAELMMGHARTIGSHDHLDEQRQAFEHLSAWMIEVAREMGPMEQTYYHRRCPMAGDGEAGWMEHHVEVRQNPYKGEHRDHFREHYNEGRHGGHQRGGHHGDEHHGKHMKDCVITVEQFD